MDQDVQLVEGEKRHNAAEHIGAKAEALIRLQRSKLNVPPFTVIPYTDWEVNLHGAAGGRIRTLCERLYATSDVFIRQGLAAILRQEIGSWTIPHHILEQMNEWIRTNADAAATIVRSSADLEDCVGSSAAGQYDSVIVATNVPAVSRAAMTVLTSYYSDRAVAYRRSFDLPELGPRMGLIVQRAINPDTSGVTFGCDPISGNHELLIIEATLGLATTLVAGMVTPDRFTLDKVTGKLVDKRVGSKRLKELIAEDATVERSINSATANRALCLGSDSLQRLWSTYLAIERLSGCPQDVEWLYANGILHIVQARPVTVGRP
jgi:pyruvate,water dikinase